VLFRSPRRPLLQATGAPADAGERLRVFEADLTADAGWAEAAAGCGLVAHLASPLPRGVPKHADELIVPARDGALRALRAARDAVVGAQLEHLLGPKWSGRHHEGAHP
jgi:dihydroflavonol-4-reductase